MEGGVVLPERDLVLLEEALAPGDREAVGLPLTEELKLRVVEGVGAAVPVPLLLCVPVVAVLGDQCAYFIGRRIGPALFDKEDSRLFKKRYVTESLKQKEKDSAAAQKGADKLAGKPSVTKKARTTKKAQDDSAQPDAN